MVNLQILNPNLIAPKVAKTIVNTIDDVLRFKNRCVLVPSAGKTLLDTWAVLRTNYSSAIDWSKVVCVQMDEYYELPSDSTESFAYQIKNELVIPLGIGSFITFFNFSGELNLTLSEYDRLIDDMGGVDVMIHGVGRNCHLGFNEPSNDDVLESTRVVKLSEITRQANHTKNMFGVTLGMDAMISSRNTIVVITGIHKQYAVEALLTKSLSMKHPVTYLRELESCSVFLDRNSMNENLIKQNNSFLLPFDIGMINKYQL